ncbi:uncharacterized protein BP5553_03705 [Venustampulla echinocandica]|uniref:Uncharacterized protein n=1 Tax=Venustampulla echinocandica TaxID=2656787 RepID=A0A370TUZ9_9HELO|nr:uncharacterized protein BP5553_03705 [Venustampulla echinocandica]RDL39365.1 hypothetical protein BP5553_03705 [Venustampulla echinocandica]
MQQYTNKVFITFIGVLGFLFCLAICIWVHRLWTARRYYLLDFERLSAEAKAFNEETTRITRNADQDGGAEWATIPANIEMICMANDYDASIRIALAAWDDIIRLELEEDWDESNGDKMLKRRRRNHSLYVIKLMRNKAIEGVRCRKKLSGQLQKIDSGAMLRYEPLPSLPLPNSLLGVEYHHILTNHARTPDDNRIMPGSTIIGKEGRGSSAPEYSQSARKNAGTLSSPDV